MMMMLMNIYAYIANIQVYLGDDYAKTTHIFFFFIFIFIFIFIFEENGMAFIIVLASNTYVVHLLIWASK